MISKIIKKQQKITFESLLKLLVRIAKKSSGGDIKQALNTLICNHFMPLLDYLESQGN